jgi:hypothetical protein
MPYSNVWSANTPLGPDPANVDDDLRKLRLDIQERMNDLGDWTTNPIKVFPRAVWTHYAGGLVVSGTPAYSGVAEYVKSNQLSAAISVLFPLPFGDGTVLNSVIARVYRDAAAGIALSVHRMDINDVRTQVATVASADTGWHELSLDLAAHTLVSDNIYVARVIVTADNITTDSARLAGIKIL